jgi:hypothetical protein
VIAQPFVGIHRAVGIDLEEFQLLAELAAHHGSREFQIEWAKLVERELTGDYNVLNIFKNKRSCNQTGIFWQLELSGTKYGQ